MTLISYPRDIPAELRINKVKFTLDTDVEISPVRSGVSIVANLGPSLWMANCSTAVLDEEKLGIVRSFFDTLQLGESFYFYDLLRAYPWAYRKVGFGTLTVSASPFSGSGKIDDVPNTKQIALKALPIGFILSAGDYLSFAYGGSQALHRIAAGGVAGGDGKLTVEVRPTVRPGWTANTDVAFRNPSAEMVVIPKTYDEDIDVSLSGTVSFQATQVL